MRLAGIGVTKVVYGGKPESAEIWRDALLSLKPDLDLTLSPEACAPAEVDILLYEPSGAIRDLSPFGKVAAIQSLWAGVETLLANETLPSGPALLRMVEPGMIAGMSDYVIGHVYRAHLGMTQQILDQRNKIWGDGSPPLASDRRVGIVGLGELGRDAATKLAQLGFRVSGWSRSEKAISGVTCLCGADGFERLLSKSDILILLAPLTPETENLINAAAFAAMPQGAHLINAARGALVDEDALLGALDSGHVATASLDVMRQEPLPTTHPFWSHDRVLITPHIASATRPKTAAATIIAQIERFERGEPFLHRVERDRGY